MIAAPVAVSGAVGLICMGFVWLALTHGMGLGIHDQDEFYIACELIAESLEGSVDDMQDYRAAEKILDNNDMSMMVFVFGVVILGVLR